MRRDLKLGKSWDEMTREEKLECIDVLNKILDEVFLSLRSEFNDILIRGKSTLRIEGKLFVDINPNDDPRLP